MVDLGLVFEVLEGGFLRGFLGKIIGDNPSNWDFSGDNGFFGISWSIIGDFGIFLLVESA